MATRAATFAAKVRNLHEFQLRLVNNAATLPSGLDIANTLKYFSQTLLGILKDVPDFPLLMVYKKERDSKRMALYPSLDYRGLYSVVVQLLEVMPLVPSHVDVLGQSLICTILCLIPFLEHDQLENIPSLVAGSIVHLPSRVHGYIVQVLCYYILPLIMSIPPGENPSSMHHSVPGILMAVLQYTDNTAYHCQLMETLMALKPDVARDLLCVIAHGTLKARVAGAHLLFYYWPSLNPTLYDRRGVNVKFSGWKPLPCQRDDCRSSGETADVVKLCLDHRLAVIQNATENGPLLALCDECAEEVKRCLPPTNVQTTDEPLVEILLPMQQVSILCDNSSCRSTEKTASVSCFSPGCASYNNQKPIRYCLQCHSIRHNNRRGGDHVFHCNLTSGWEMPLEMQSHVVEAIVSLLKEAQPYTFERSSESSDRLTRAGLWLCGDLDTIYSVPLEERRLLSRYGVWLLVALTKPIAEAAKHIIGRLIGALFHWFDTTAYVTEDQAGSVLEPLKSDLLHDWIVQAQQNQLDVLIDCLLPWPPAPARVGGSWDTHSPRAVHIKEGFNRLFGLVPYEIITVDLWNHVIPHWLEAIVTSVPSDEWVEFRTTLNKLLDSEMSPLGFDAQQMFKFLAVRFRGTSLGVQEQALNWLQLLSSLHISVIITLLVNVFEEGVTTCKLDDSQTDPQGGIDVEEIRPLSPASNRSLPVPEVLMSIPEKSLACHVLMLDILLEQLEIQEVPSNGGLSAIPLVQQCLMLLKDMLHVRQNMLHNCATADCPMCILLTSWYQLAQELIAFFAPLHAAAISDLMEDDSSNDLVATFSTQTAPSADNKKTAGNEGRSAGDDGKSGGHDLKMLSSITLVTASQVLTAKMETVPEALDMAPILPSERVLKAVAKAVTLTEMDVGSAKAEVAHPTLVTSDLDDGTGAANLCGDSGDQSGQFWVTSAGKFKFSLEELPNHLQLIYGFLKELYHVIRPDTQRHLLRCVEVLCLHCEVLSKAAKEHPGFVIWVQENLTIAQLWNLLESQTSHVAQTAVSILLHCLTLTGGSDVFWKIMDADFHSREWKVRFSAVERTILMCQFLETSTVKQSSVLQSILSNAFCFLVASMDDIHAAVATRATILLESIHDGALRLLVWCVEQQFDSFISDRPLLLQTILALNHHQSLSKRKILTWKFFYRRFDALFLEAQVSLQRAGETGIEVRDLANSDINSLNFTKKYVRAKEALKRFAPPLGSPSVQPRTLMRSLSLSTASGGVSGGIGVLGNFYRKAAAGIGRQPNIPVERVDREREKTYSRQGSSAQMKLRGNRMVPTFGIDGYMTNRGHSHGQTGSPQDDAYVALLLQRFSESDDFDGETHSLLITALMQYLSQPEVAQAADDKCPPAMRSLVLKHLSLLLGYNPTDRAFCLTPQKLRSSATFNAFLSALPHFLDRNLTIGATLLPMTLSMLIFCPAPPSHNNHVIWFQCQGQSGLPSHGSIGTAAGLATGGPGNSVNDRSGSSRIYKPSYSLWYLEPHPRRMWLQTVLVILYKYRYNQPSLAPQIQSIIRIVLNTLESQYHRCRYGGIGATITHAHPSGQITSGIRTREQSQASFSTDGDALATEASDSANRTPRTPGMMSHGVGLSTVLGIAGLGWGASGSSPLHSAPSKASAPSGRPHREPGGSVSSECDLDASDMDGIELEVIPESPKSGRPDLEWDSNRGSIGDLEVLSEMSHPEAVASGATAATSPGDLAVAACLRPVVYEAHTVLSSGNKSEETPSSGTRTRQRKMGIAMAPDMPLETSHAEAPPPVPPPAPVPSFTIPSNVKQSSLRVGEDCVCHRCSKCGGVFEEFSEDELGLCIVVLSTFTHREPTLAASFLPEVLRCVSKCSSSTAYIWQPGSNIHVPGGVTSIASQFLRCILHQLTPNKVFVQLFQTQVPDGMKQSFFKTMAQALTDFSELNPVAPLQLLLESLNEEKQLISNQVALMLPNMACYMECLPLDTCGAPCTALLGQMEIFFTRLILILPSLSPGPNGGANQHGNFLLRIMCCGTRMAGLVNARNVFDPFAKVLIFILQHLSFDYKHLVETCHLCFRNFNKDREKYLLTRTVVDELVSVMKFKSGLPDATLIVCVHFTLQDAGGTLPPNCLLDDDGQKVLLANGLPTSDGSLCNPPTGAFDCMRPHFHDVVEFLADVHTLTKLKSNSRVACPSGPGIHEDTLGGTVKAGMAQLLSLELVRGNGKDNRCILRYMPWLFNPPSAIQQGPREFLECVSHVRLLSWLLLGALQHTALLSNNNNHALPTGTSSSACMPIPFDVSCHVADHIQGILAGFAEQSKASVLHMSSLYHAFLLCQLWTIYLEFMAIQHATNHEQQSVILNVLVDFWSKITPSVLQLVAHSSMLAEMVNLHFLSLMEALGECKSTILSLLLPLWSPVLHAHSSQTQLPTHLEVRHQACIEGTPSNPMHVSDDGHADNHLESWILRWLLKLQFKMGQIEIQSSTASQFYNV